MRKHKSLVLLKYLLLLTIAFIVVIQSTKANPVVAQVIRLIDIPYISIPIITIFFVIGALVEYIYFKIIMSRITFTGRDNNKALLHSIFKINLITYPLTQVLAYICCILFPFFFWFYIILIEILVIMIEWKLLNFELHRIFEVNMASKRVLKNSILANLSSFLIGFFGFILILI